MFRGGSCSLTACVGREKALTKEKAARLFITWLGVRASMEAGNVQCFIQRTQIVLDCMCGQQPKECLDFEFLAYFPSGL